LTSFSWVFFCGHWKGKKNQPIHPKKNARFRVQPVLGSSWLFFIMNQPWVVPVDLFQTLKWFQLRFHATLNQDPV
jgi:hypothetical protein